MVETAVEIRPSQRVEALLWALEALGVTPLNTFWWEDCCYLADMYNPDMIRGFWGIK